MFDVNMIASEVIWFLVVDGRGALLEESQVSGKYILSEYGYTSFWKRISCLISFLMAYPAKVFLVL